ncbi:MAG: hypothetical protein REH79_02250, partial [Spiroplasma sp.]|nr:hypothetical protein [Spiroplasma sp.]
KTYVDSQNALKADKTYVEEQDALKANKIYVDEQDATKQATLIDTGVNQNIKTINNQSILGQGDITIAASEGAILDNNIEIYDNESNNFVAYKMDPLDWSKANNKSITNKKYVDDQTNLKQNKLDNDLKTTDKTVVGAINELKSKLDTVESQGALKADKTYVDSQNAAKQNILTAVPPLKIATVTAQESSEQTKLTSDEISITKNRLYTKYQEIDVNSNSYVFDDYKPGYWHQFYFLIDTTDSKKLIGSLERPIGLPDDYISSNVCVDFESITSIMMWFNPQTKIVEAKNWKQGSINITKLIIFRKEGI